MLVPYEIPLSHWKKQGIQLESIPGKVGYLQPSEKRPEDSLFYLDFEEEEIKRQGLRVISSSYLTDTKVALRGKKSAFFSGKENQILISTQSLFPRPNTDFSIRIPILLNEQGSSSVILEKKLLIAGKMFGFVLELSENYPVLKIHNIIQFHNGETKSVILKSSEAVPRKDWHAITIYMDCMRGYVALYQNGKLRADYYERNMDFKEIAFPEEDSLPLVLGKNYFGHMDGIHFHKGKPLVEEFYSKYSSVSYDSTTHQANQESGYMYSPILMTIHSGSQIQNITPVLETPKDTLVQIFFRGSDSPFNEESNLLWERPEDFKRRFKFYQWKVAMRPDPIGKQVPGLQGFHYLLKEERPPRIPIGLRVQKVDKTNICLAWNSNHEREVQAGGGYLIQYGFAADKMIGTLSVDENFLPISGKSENQDYMNLSICLTEELLYNNFYFPKVRDLPKNLEKELHRSQREKTGHFLKPGITYYFKISAYNKYYDAKTYSDQISPPSEAISFSFPWEG